MQEYMDIDAGALVTPIGLPPYAERALAILEAGDAEAWVVGGFVRDALLGRASKDVDIACSASWETVRDLFQAAGCPTHETGTAHGTITVVVDEHALEITTYRADSEYLDARHPKHVAFVKTIEEDLARRDFTINAIAFHPERGLLDPFGGQVDARAGKLRAVGDAKLRFAEDALRILRGCRFCSQLGFAVEPATFQGMLENKHLLSKVSSERITHELQDLLLGEHVGRALRDTVGVLSAVLPELVAMRGFDQRTPYHVHDVFEHTVRVVEATPPYPLVRWAALFHDMGKPGAFFTDEEGTGHFYGHADLSIFLGRGIMRRLCFSSSFEERVLLLVKRHDDVIEATPKSVKRALGRLGGNTELFHALCDIRRADALGQAPRCRGRVALTDEIEAILQEIIERDEAFSLKQLAVNGRDAIETGIPQGPCIGRALQAALAAVIDDEVPNEREALLEFMGKWSA